MAYGNAGSLGGPPAQPPAQPPGTQGPGVKKTKAPRLGGSIGGSPPAQSTNVPWDQPCPPILSAPGSIIDPDWCHKSAPGPGGGGGGGGGGISLPRGGGGGGPKPGDIPRPDLPPIDPQANFDPELEAYRERFRGHLGNLESGTGYAMDVMRGQQQDQLEADVERARQAAAASGIPFDEAQFRSEGARGINSAMAQEKLGREQMMTDAYARGLPIIAEPASERFNRLELDLRRDVADAESVLDLYGRDIQKYGIDMNAATAANNALMQFYSSLMSGMFGSFGNMSQGINYTSNI